MQICWTQLFLIHILEKNIQNGFYPAASSCRQYKDSRWGFCYWTFFSSAFSSLKETHSKASFWRASCSWLCHKDSRWGFCCLSFLRKLVGHNCSWSVFSHVVHFEEEKQFPAAAAAHSWPRRHKASRWGFSCCSFLQTHLHSSHCNMTSSSWSSAFGLPSHSFTDVSSPLNFGVFLWILEFYSEFKCISLNCGVFLWIAVCFSVYFPAFLIIAVWPDPLIPISSKGYSTWSFVQPKKEKDFDQNSWPPISSNAGECKGMGADGQRRSCLRARPSFSSSWGIDKLVNARQTHEITFSGCILARQLIWEPVSNYQIHEQI